MTRQEELELKVESHLAMLKGSFCRISWWRRWLRLLSEDSYQESKNLHSAMSRLSGFLTHSKKLCDNEDRGRKVLRNAEREFSIVIKKYPKLSPWRFYGLET